MYIKKNDSQKIIITYLFYNSIEYVWLQIINDRFLRKVIKLISLSDHTCFVTKISAVVYVMLTMLATI